MKYFHGIKHKDMEEFHTFIYNDGYVTVSGDYACDPNISANLGGDWDDYLAGKYVLLNEEQQAYLNNHPTSTPYEAFNMTETVEASDYDKELVISKIREYDASSEVNTFYVNGVPAWFDKYNRGFISKSISAEIEAGKDTTVIWINNTPYTMSIDDAKQMFINLELYAIACYNNTQSNIATVKAMTLKSELRSFDITQGYPEKLNFNL